MAEELGAELHHIPSQKCTLDNVEEVIRMCWYVAQRGGFHIVLVDEADQMSNAAQLALLSKLDSTARPPKTIFVFTCNSTERLEKRFLSRCMVLEFSSYGMRAELAEFLAKVWDAEVGHSSDMPEAKKPDFERIAKDATNNVRDALNRLEVELLAA
jgi:replication-associated recombination protein RarA